MKVCIIGDGLVGLILAKVLAKKALSVDIFFNSKLKKYSQTRTTGITKSNINYLNRNVLNIEKILWEIKQIKIYTENFKNSEILNFSNFSEQIFSIVKKCVRTEKYILNQNTPLRTSSGSSSVPYHPTAFESWIFGSREHFGDRSM